MRACRGTSSSARQPTPGRARLRTVISAVDRSHQISDRITDAIKEHYRDTTLTVHIEPCYGDCLPECVDECLLDDDERQAAKKKSR